MPSAKVWMLGLPGHEDLVTLEEVARLISGGQLRETDLVKKIGSPWRAANEIPELLTYFGGKSPLRVREGPKPSTTRVPAADVKPTSRVPKAEGSPRDTRPPSASRPPREGPRKTHPPSASRPPEARKPVETRAPDPPLPEDVPRPPAAAPRILYPMTPKYFSPVDLLRSASHAFEPKKLILAASMLVPLMISWSIVMYFQRGAGSALFRMLLFVGATAIFVFGASVIFTVLSYVTRRQLEGERFRISDVVGYATRNLVTALVYPALVLLPSLLALACLWLLGFLRDASPGLAAALRIGYVVPMFFALAAVLGAFLYQLASMYIPAAAAIEGQGLAGSVQAAWANTRFQRGRVVLHWLIVTVAAGVISAVCLEMALLTLTLPDVVFSRPEGRIRERWESFTALFAVYQGLAFGLGLTLPLSLFSTLGVLSYMSLRHPVSAPLAAGLMDETGPIDYGPAAMEATHPASETHPGSSPLPAGETRGATSKPPEDGGSSPSKN